MIAPNIARTPKNFASMMPPVMNSNEDHDPNLGGEGTQDRVEWQEVPFRNDVCRRRKRVCFDVVVWVTQVVRHKANNREEHSQDNRQREQSL